MNLLKAMMFQLCLAMSFSLQAAAPDFDLHVSAKDREGTPVAAAVVMVEPYGKWGITGDDGTLMLKSIPFSKSAEYKITLSILGYKTLTLPFVPSQTRANDIVAVLEEESMAMDEVVVVAESKKSGESTASKIGRMAMDHLQATSLNDLLQLIPGQVSMSNPSLTRASHFSTRTLYDNTGGSAVVMDGVPIANNAAFEGNEGIDLRSIGTDDLQSVEVIRGIASAEYGDVSSGTMIVNSKIGITDLNLRAKIMPGIMQFYAGKGFKAGNFGNLNISADYAHGKSDPRYHTDTYDRILANLAHSKLVLDGRWDLTTKLNFTATKDWSGADPAAPEALRNYFKQRKAWSLRFNHSGRINLDKRFAGTIRYDLSYQYNHVHQYEEELMTMNGGTVFDAVGDGLHVGEPYPRSFETKTGTRSVPMNVYAKVSDIFHLDKGRFLNRINIGAEFKAEGNTGIGRYDASSRKAFAQERLRRYCDIPWLNQFSLYAEDRFTIPLARKSNYPNIKGQFGLRWTMIQPGRKEFMNSWSPRLNLSVNFTDWATLRAGWGFSEKLPNLQMLYPDPVFFDFYSMSVTNGQDAYYLYSTRRFDLDNPSIRPMRNNKFEVGLDFRPHNAMSFSLVAYLEKCKNGFGSDLSAWTALRFPVWEPGDVDFNGPVPEYDLEKPSHLQTSIVNLVRPGNTMSECNWGIEYDFDFGKIRATNTAFYLNGAYTVSSVNSRNPAYQQPVGKVSSWPDVYLVYPEGTGSRSERRRFSTALRVVQHIPVIRFIVSATAQFVFYDYDHRILYGERPIGYLTDDHQPETWQDGCGPVHYTAFTPEQLADPDYTFEGYKLKDQIVDKIIANRPTVWPPVWTLNLRVTKEIGDFMGFSFYVNNMLFHQPWQKTSTSTNLIERNGSLFSYGLELFLHF